MEECSHKSPPSRPGRYRLPVRLARLGAGTNQRHEFFRDEVLGQDHRSTGSDGFPAAIVPFVRYKPDNPGFRSDSANPADRTDAAAEREVQVDECKIRPRLGEEQDSGVRIRDRTSELHVGLGFYENS